MDNVFGVSTQILPGEPLWAEPEPEPCAVVIFGITGDLARRKLVPALFALAHEHRLPTQLALIGVGSRCPDLDTLRQELHQGLKEFARVPLAEETWKWLLTRLTYVRGASAEVETYTKLAAALRQADAAHQTAGNRLFYLATPAREFAPIVQRLHESHLLRRAPRTKEQWPRLVVEKPFGRDLASARELNHNLGAVLDEDQIFRIDHYLGKETVQNLLVFRFGNSIFEPLWNQKYIDHVQITASETVGVETRGRFYDATGALRDMVQSHLLQVLSLTALEPPVSFRADDLRDESVRLLRSVRPLATAEVAGHAVRAQYRGYRDERDVSADSRTPTYVALRLFIDNWRWHGVPFYLRTGKRLARRVTEVTVHFKPIPFCVFGREDVCQRIDPNILVMRIQPNEGISLRFCSKVPGQDLAVGNVTMDFDYANAFAKPVQEAYERLLLDALRGDASLFWRQDAIEHAWALVTPVLEAWQADAASPLPQYAPGSAGPDEARTLLARDRRFWRELA
jgi:glucose-6-phosphate 1-dehydrogenase